jgi:hypothetical protein
VSSSDRYGSDVLQAGWNTPRRPQSTPLTLARGQVVEDASTGFCGAVLRWENGIVVLEDRRGRTRSFPVGAGFLVEGKPVTLTVPARAAATAPRRTASGSVATPGGDKAKVALPSRIYVEGRHDAELVEKIWGDDLRHVGVVVEYLGGVDDLPAIVDDFAPAPGRRLGVLVDHLVAGSKESRIVAGVGSRHVLVTGHPYVDVWQAVKPTALNIDHWPEVPRGTPWKAGIAAALGVPDPRQMWRLVLASVDSYADVEVPLLRAVEELIDFVTA